MSMTTLDDLDAFAGEDESLANSGIDEAPLPAKPRKRRSKHVDPFSTGQPLPGEEPEPPAALTAPHVYAAICEVTAGLSQIGIGKTRKNSQQGYQFRGIDDIYNALSALLVRHRLVILPHVDDRTTAERQTKGGGLLNYVTVKMSFDLVSAVDGSRERVSSFGEAMDSGDKATNKALSTAYKYMAMQVFCIPTIGIDPEENTYEVAAAKTHPVTPTADNSAEQQLTADNSRRQQPPHEDPLDPLRPPAGMGAQLHLDKLLATLTEKLALGRDEAETWFKALPPADKQILRDRREARH